MHRGTYSGAKYEIMGKLKVPMQGRSILRTKIRQNGYMPIPKSQGRVMTLDTELKWYIGGRIVP